MLRRLYKRIDREWGRPDVVNLVSSLQGYEVMELCRREKLPLFFMEHSSYVITEPEDGLIHKRLREVMAAAAVNACVSSAVRRVMEPYGETRVIPDIVDGERFHPLEFPRDYDGFLFRAMGQLRPIKGYDVPVSYTHLDVYKRQVVCRNGWFNEVAFVLLAGTKAFLFCAGGKESCTTRYPRI